MVPFSVVIKPPRAALFHRQAGRWIACGTGTLIGQRLFGADEKRGWKEMGVCLLQLINLIFAETEKINLKESMINTRR